MNEKKTTTVDELKKSYKQLEIDYHNLYMGMLKLYQQLTMDTEDILYIFDPKNRKVYANKSAMDLIGVPEHMDFTGKDYTLLEFVEPEYREQFINTHIMVQKGEAKEVTETVKLRQTNGNKVVYEHRLIALCNDKGKATGVCIGKFHDVTERYIKDMGHQRYRNLVTTASVFHFKYDQKMDKLSVDIPKNLRTNEWLTEKNIYFWSKMIKEEKVCPKADIAALLDFIKNGSKKPLQISLYDSYSEEYRWYALSGIVKDYFISGTIEDITDYENDSQDKEKIKKVLECITQNRMLIAIIDLVEDTFEVLLADQNDFQGVIPKIGNHDELDSFLGDTVESEYKDKLVEFCKLEQIKEKLKSNKMVECEVQIKNANHAWRHVIIQAMEYNEQEEVSKVILSFLNLDSLDTEKKPGKPTANEEAYMIQQVRQESKEQETEIKNVAAKVLLVEDFAINAECQMDILHQACVEVDWAKNGEEAIKNVVENNPGYYDFVLMDTKMPEKDGYETTKEIRRLKEQSVEKLPIIGISIEDSEENIDKAKEAGMNEHIQKPVSGSQINYLVEKYVNKK